MALVEAEGQSVRQALQRVLDSPVFARQERLCRFLRFVVERHLEGRDGELKESHGYFAIYYLLPLGRIEEAIRQLRIAEKSDLLFQFFLGDALADAGRNKEAAAVCENLPPQNPVRSQCILGALVRLGRGSEVIQNYGARSDNPAWVEAVLACAYTRAGRREEAEKAAARAGRIYRAPALACLGDKERVFEVLDHAAPSGPIRIGWFLLRVDRESPALLRGDPRLQALRRKVGLPE